VGTEKRERQKANRAQRQYDEARGARNSAIKRNTVRWVVGGIAAVGVVVFVAWVGGAFDSDDEGDIATADDTVPTETVPSASSVPVTTAPGATETTVPEPGNPDTCPATDGSEEQQREFEAYPPMCIDPATTYTAEVVTNHGDVTIEFDAERAPLAVNNFVTLARYKYYDGTECHRVISEFVVQCGDPTATGTGGPGYTFADELPEEGEYEIGSVAMANSGPDTNGSQFFLISGPNGAALPPNFSLFGKVVDGLDVLDEMQNVPTDPSDRPIDAVIIESVTITES